MVPDLFSIFFSTKNKFKKKLSKNKRNMLMKVSEPVKKNKIYSQWANLSTKKFLQDSFVKKFTCLSKGF